MAGGCPHKNILDCPLYLAAHIANAIGCDDGRLHESGCAVDRRLNYDKAVAAFRATHPREVAIVEFQRDVRMSSEQRARNMRDAGIQ